MSCQESFYGFSEYFDMNNLKTLIGKPADPVGVAVRAPALRSGPRTQPGAETSGFFEFI